ncbi:YkvA family protein [Bacillus sp. UNC438CL73TsuS30]|uniref:YkvA family protein n=1 Tax=Bacillus sp. UNC438CL73TsuS30 TaxID=1340434 RepID=UPI000B260FB2|nr:YkvA family protein [Bacillus sp. UNC438CL73TsuS30]
MFGNKEKIEKEFTKYKDKALEFINHQQETNELMKQATTKVKEKKNSLGDAFGKIELLIELIKAYSKGDYRNISKSTLATVIGAILYFASPIDMIPDFIVGLGIVDDAAVIGYAIKKISGELVEFEKWKEKEEKSRNNLEGQDVGAGQSKSPLD